MTKLQRLIAGVLALLLLLAACASLPPQSNRPQTFSLPDTEPTRLSAIFAQGEQSHPDSSAFHLLQNPIDAIVVRVVLAETAEDGTSKEVVSEPDASFMRRVSIWLLDLLPIESEL